MLRYSATLTAVGMVSVCVNLLFSIGVARKRVNIARIQARDAGKLSGTAVAGIEMMESIQASGAENGFFAKWAEYQASVRAQSMKLARFNLRMGALPGLVSALTNALVMMLGVYMVMRGNFTVGMIIAFQSFLSAFANPANALIHTGQTLQEMQARMARVEDVMKHPSDSVLAAQMAREPREDEDADKLSGAIALRHVCFGYARLSPPLIEDFSLDLRTGSCVAIVGPSGCGKSTLLKLISGLYAPWSGEILFDGKPIGEIDRSVFTSSLAVVDQEPVLFEDTIANNIKMWDRSIEDFEMIMAARDARLHEDIMQREGGYRSSIAEDGKDLSGGQRQRMEIARVLAQDPTIIIMDEATSAMDAKTEYEVVKSIRERGVTCIIVSHRLSAIRDCDEIIVMDGGAMIERGTHAALCAKGGAYAALIASE